MRRHAAAIAGFAGILTTLLWLAAHHFDAAQQRQVSYRYVADALMAPPARETQVAWQASDRPMVRPLTQADAAGIGRALTEAWQLIAAAQATGETAALGDRLTGVALERARLSVADAAQHGGRMVVLSHRARPTFFHLDGSVFQAEVTLLVARYVVSPQGLKHYELTQDRGIATLLNEANGWRLFSYERRVAHSVDTENAQWSGRTDGVNYYPAGTPWRDFWPSYDPAQTEADFARIRALGANSVRIFLTRSAFLSRDGAQTALDNLSHLLDAAHRAGLSVIPTLFDLKQDFRVTTWADDVRYLNRVLPVLATAPAVSFVDLKNEPDLDFSAHGIAEITAWLRSMMGMTRMIAPDLPLTIGWSAATFAQRHAAALDVISYHDYAPAGQTRETLETVRRNAHGKPVVVSEIGTSSYAPLGGAAGSESTQARQLAARMAALAKADGVLVWTLYDFARVDPTVVGASPWVRRLQGAFGLFRADGTEKEAAAVVRNQVQNHH